MKCIERISQLRNCGIFRNFSWSSSLPDFGRFNLIYGWNGTGKTTLSRLFRDLEHSQKPELGEVVLNVDGDVISNGEFSEADLEIRVFNRDFIAANVFPQAGGDIQPVFVLGSGNVEKQKEIEKLTLQLSTAQTNLASARTTQTTARKDFDQLCIDQAKSIKETLRSSGENPYNNYDKSNYSDDAVKFIEANSATSLLTDQEREGLLVQLHATPMPKVSTISYSLPDFESIVDTLADITEISMVSFAIETLKEDPTLADWVHDGLKLLRDRTSDLC